MRSVSRGKDRMEALEILINEYQYFCHTGLGGCACSELRGKMEFEVEFKDCLALFWGRFNRAFPDKDFK